MTNNVGAGKTIARLGPRSVLICTTDPMRFVSGGATGVQQQTGGEVAAGEESIEAATAKLRLSDGDSDGEQWQVRCVAFSRSCLSSKHFRTPPRPSSKTHTPYSSGLAFEFCIEFRKKR